MELDFALLAKAAEMSDSGLMSLVGGGFDGIAVEKLPATLPPFAVVARFSAGQDEVQKEHSISFELVSPSGEIKRFVDRSRIEFSPSEHESRLSHASGIAMIGFKFESAGKYQIRLFTNDQLAKTLDLYVVLQAAQKAAEK